MRVTNYTDFRQNLANHLDSVVDNHAPVLITRTGNKPPVVVMSMEDYAGWEETEFLMRDPKNRELLLESIHQANLGNVTERELID